MDITVRALWSLIHGMGFGGLFLLACSGALMELGRHYAPSASAPLAESDQRFFRAYLAAMSACAWLAVLSGTYIVYPWYRALPPPGATSLSGFPQRQLLSHPATASWHTLGMEWKEHVAWLAPIAITMAWAVAMRYGRALKAHPQLRNLVLCFVAASMLAAGIAGFLGAEIDDHAPVDGGHTFHLTHGA